MKLKIAVVGIAIALTSIAMAKAADLFPHASWVASATNDVKCFQSKRGFLFDTTGPCSKFIEPAAVALGKTFQADGNVIPINIIVVMKDDDSGTTICSAASEDNQIPRGGDMPSDRIWLVIPKCLPLR